MTLRRKLVLLASLYVAQGVPFGFFTQALPVLLREQGLSLPAIGFAQLLMLPWALKFAWAPLLDAIHAPRFGRRRAAIIPLQLVACGILALLALTGSPEAIGLLCAGVLIVNLAAATQDIATDALAVEILAPRELGLGNGLQVGAYRAGMIVGGGVMLIVFGRYGWTTAFLGMAAILAVVTVPIALHREAPPPSVNEARPRFTAVLREALARPGMRRWMTVLVTYKTGEWFAAGMLRTFLKDAGQSLDELGTMLGFVGFSTALLGAMLGGAATAYVGRRRALIVFGLAQTLGLASMMFAVFAPSQGAFYAVTVAEHLTSSMATAALFTAMMDFCREDHAGTDYTIQASIVVIASGAASGLSGVSAHALGYAGHFALAAGMSAVGVLAVALYRPSDPSYALR